MHQVFISLRYFLLFICFNSFLHLHAQNPDSSRTFAIQYYQHRYSITFNSTGDKITGTRNREKIPSGLMEASVFIEADVGVEPFPDNSYQISPRDTNTWFVPIEMGKKPFKILPGNCIKMSCWQKQFYNECPASSLLYLPERITFIGGIDAMCEQSNLYMITHTPCDSIYGYEYFSGGVIVQADSVLISDPEWFIPNPQPYIIFKEDRD